MKSDYNGLVEQSEMNQSVDENFNNIHCLRLRWTLTGIISSYLQLVMVSGLVVCTSPHVLTPVFVEVRI
jgi:hypothetical protein